MQRDLLILNLLLLIASLLILVLSLVLMIDVRGVLTPQYVSAPTETPIFLETPPLLRGTPPYCNNIVVGPGAYVESRIVDLDPTIDIDSKASAMIRRFSGEWERVYYSRTEQMNDYLKTLRLGECWSGGVPPACVMGHYPGEPPGRKPCTYPTPIGGNTATPFLRITTPTPKTK
jgi:hypothetical protein